MYCKTCNNHYEYTINNICLKCQLKNILNSKEHQLFFLDPEILYFILLNDYKFVGPQWFTNSNNNWKKNYYNIINEKKYNKIEGLRLPFNLQNIKTQVLINLKKYYYPDNYKELFNPRIQGNYKNHFIEYENYIDNILYNFLLINTNIKQCDICGIYSGEKFIINLNTNQKCLPCILKIENLSEWLEVSDIRKIEKKYKHDYNTEIILYIKGKENDYDNKEILDLLNRKRLMYTMINIDKIANKEIEKGIHKWNYVLKYPCLIIGKNHIVGNDIKNLKEQLLEIFN